MVSQLEVRIRMLQTRRAGSSSWITTFSYELLQRADHVIVDAGSMRFLGDQTADRQLLGHGNAGASERDRWQPWL